MPFKDRAAPAPVNNLTITITAINVDVNLILICGLEIIIYTPMTRYLVTFNSKREEFVTELPPNE